MSYEIHSCDNCGLTANSCGKGTSHLCPMRRRYCSLALLSGMHCSSAASVRLIPQSANTTTSNRKETQVHGEGQSNVERPGAARRSGLQGTIRDRRDHL
jgi:hypothetical protein